MPRGGEDLVTEMGIERLPADYLDDAADSVNVNIAFPHSAGIEDQRHARAFSIIEDLPLGLCSLRGLRRLLPTRSTDTPQGRYCRRRAPSHRVARSRYIRATDACTPSPRPCARR